ncbi:CPBP family intramembrane metalloprotease [Luteimonas fraxinea]|uniref:CPBP family intramembrane metalloprotease n=1 Tax=Luteimonas fraxinea TaxID=2901869 RepID=A0ABS8UDK0_9GAMM|nr:CPBP family intramembrane glutamic endopeptidase [Luteimonas fraxinea]MCD9097566.1 CPBP family intramembrane metalloprotease [Luteimonas fraxinea]MCD9124883.1 CPBP family intramembrane metalloprotease [Luteimonas fraxinea]UHH08466.1 CPBP family intramembrane metalloprotease [Luteimonas fraxinea]
MTLRLSHGGERSRMRILHHNAHDTAPAAPRAGAVGALSWVLLLAIAVSAPFRSGWLQWPDAPVLAGVPIFTALIEGLGPLIAASALACFSAHARRPVTLTGGRPARAIAMAVVVPLAFAAVGAINGHAMSAALIGTTTLVYCVMEESAWRGALHNRLSGYAPTRRALVIGGTWYLWHLSFLAPDTTWARELTALGCLMAGSLLLGRLADRSRSIVVVACFHLIVNVLAFNTLAAALSAPQRFAVAALCLLAWWPLLHSARRRGPARRAPRGSPKRLSRG